MQPEPIRQLTVTTPSILQRVNAWIVWEGGVEEIVQAHAVAWTKRAVLVRFVPHLTSTRRGSGQGRSRGPGRGPVAVGARISWPGARGVVSGRDNAVDRVPWGRVGGKPLPTGVPKT